jgi:uncharacterized protein (TIGR02996 family)
MSEREAFIEAIAAHPDEDTPRLAFADWLQENGDDSGPAGRAGSSPGAGPGSAEARAEFIRIQCELARPVAPGGDPGRWPKLYDRCAALFTTHWRNWFGPLFRALGADEPDPDGRPYYPPSASGPLASISRTSLYHPTPLADRTYFLDRIGIDRGFATGLSLRAHHRTRPCSFADAFRLEPITGLWFSFLTSRADGTELLEPALRQLRWLLLAPEGPAHPAAVEFLSNFLASPHWSGLRSLALSNVGHEPTTPGDWVAAAVRQPWVGNLTSFNASLTDAGLRHLIDAPGLEGLESLGLFSSRLSARAVADFANLRCRPRLRELGLSSSELGPAHAAALAAIPGWDSLEELDLSFNPLGDEGATALARAPMLRNVRRLELAGTELTGAGMLTLANALDPGRIERLELTYPHWLEPEVEHELRDRFGDTLDLHSP